jgi:hypothetical protein
VSFVYELHMKQKKMEINQYEQNFIQPCYSHSGVLHHELFFIFEDPTQKMNDQMMIFGGKDLISLQNEAFLVNIQNPGVVFQNPGVRIMFYF